jgi:peptide/nickel transport system permease protein
VPDRRRGRRAGRKFAQYGLLLGLILVGSFALPRLAPGDPLTYLVGGNEAAAFSREERNRALAQFNLDAPLYEQFLDYVGGVVSGDLGNSVRYGATVGDVLLDRLPWTLLLVGGAGLLAAALALSAALSGARRRGAGAGDAGLLTGILLLSCTPPFFLGMLMLAILSAELGLLPAYGASASEGGALVDVLQRLAMPLATLTLTTTGVVYLIARSALLAELTQGYVRFARAKGVPEQRILRRHVLRNALLPIVTIFMVSLGDVLGGAVVVETVFSYPGLGTAIYEGVLARDYPLLQGALLLVAVVVVAANAIADGLYALIDPRVRRADAVPR